MKTPVTRRTFLAAAGCIGGGLALGSRLAPSLSADEKSPLLPVTCRDVTVRPTGKPDLWSALQAVGADGVEIVVTEDMSLPGVFHPTKKYTLATTEGVEQLAADAKAAGQRITGFCLANRFEERPKVEIKWCTQAARAAQALGVPAIRLDVVPARLSNADFLKLAVAALRKIMSLTESTGVAFAVENHGHTTNDPAFLKALFHGVGSERLGLTLDTGNFYWYGHPLSKVYELYETFAPRVFHTHCKSIGFPAEQREKRRPIGWKYGEYNCPIDRGDLDFARIVAILRKAGYHNDLCVEDESLGKLSGPAAVTQTVAGEVQLLKRLQA
jgi:sugar phosphate isomerase/epimerase